MKGKFLLAAIPLMVIGMISPCSAAGTKDYDLTYSTVTQEFDWGASVTKIVVDFGREVDKDISLSADDISVEVRKNYMGTEKLVQTMDYSMGQYIDSPAGQGERRIEAVYLSDEEGNVKEEDTSFVTIQLYAGPFEGYGDVLGAETETGLNMNVLLNFSYTITFEGSDGSEYICNTENENSVYTLADKFQHNQIYTTENPEILNDNYDNETLYYASFQPEDKEKHPLIIWLHGLGEGGTDTRGTVLGNRVTTLVDEEIQGIMGGAYILVPQAPTFWMNTDGILNGMNIKISKESIKSIYTETLMELILKYVQDHPGIDTDKIYIGGCSNGGYMTMNMLLLYPDYFAAAYPICEAYSDEFITDEQIEQLKEIPIWFTHAADDTVVPPEVNTVPTYKRLIDAGAENVHFTYWKDVHDITGDFKDEEGNPVRYFGHMSWMYTLNNACTIDNDYKEGKQTGEMGNGKTIFEWMSEQSLKH
ncbi:MAG: prolyl oligopeptidase family serine peptidase [Eubacteriales bacterium]|nr:prolyl oligopeptidase family serine peptidase [Eubacteriales bacterium]